MWIKNVQWFSSYMDNTSVMSTAFKRMNKNEKIIVIITISEALSGWIRDLLIIVYTKVGNFAIHVGFILLFWNYFLPLWQNLMTIHLKHIIAKYICFRIHNSNRPMHEMAISCIESNIFVSWGTLMIPFSYWNIVEILTLNPCWKSDVVTTSQFWRQTNVIKKTSRKLSNSTYI